MHYLLKNKSKTEIDKDKTALFSPEPLHEKRCYIRIYNIRHSALKISGNFIL
jgi:hypothetical protein